MNPAAVRHEKVRPGVAITHRDQLPSSSRYQLLVKIASGGMATVYVGRLSSAVGITRLVAIKRAHAHLLEDPSFGKMLIAEAKLASRIHHPNVVAVHNVEEIEGELLLVMDYVEGAALSDLMTTADDDEKNVPPMPAKVATRVLLDALAGLHAAHELTDDDGKRLGIVHRDVSPHNILVGVDGIARLTDFGIAKSSGGTGGTASAGARTSTGALKGKVAYMAPEYVEAGLLDARSDVFSLGIVLWEALTRRRLFRGASEIDSLKLVLATDVPRPSRVAPWLGTALDAVLEKALARAPAQRFSSAADLSEALEVAARRDDLLAKHGEVAAYVKLVATDALTKRRGLVRETESERDSITIVRTTAGGGGGGDEPHGRAENTSSLEGAGAGAPGHSDVRAREDNTSTAAPTAPPAIPSARTKPDFSPAMMERAHAVPLPPPSSHPSDASTFGSGVSAHLVAEARREVTAEIVRAPRSNRAIIWSAAALCIAGASVAVMFVVPAKSSSSSSAPPTPAAVAPPPVETTPTTTTSATPAPTSSSSTALLAEPLPTSKSAKAHPATPRPPPPHTVTRPAAAAAATTKPSIITTLPPDPPAQPKSDKAPPNPYE